MQRFSLEELQKAPSLKGRFASATVSLTELERAVAQYQGLLKEDGTLKDEAVMTVPKAEELQFPEGSPPPIPLAALAPDRASTLEQEIAAIKGEVASAAVVNEDHKIGVGLPPPGIEAPAPAGPGPLPIPERVTASQAIATSESPVTCAHCGWDQRNAFKPPQLDESDIPTYVRHIMSRNGRFYKTFDLCGGQIQVVLRSRSHKEIEIILEQARKDLREDKLTGVSDFQAQLQRYHVCASVAELIYGDSSAPESRKFKSLDQYKATTDQTALEVMVADVFGDISEGLFSALNTLWFDFEKLYGYLTSRVHDGDFWQAAAGAR